jgi:Ca-activated chloride channel family protein
MLTKQPPENRVRMIYFLTDGFVGNDDVVLGAAHELLGSNRIFTVGIGQAPNRALLDSLADVGRGFSTYVSLDDNGARTGAELLRLSGQPYLTDVQIDWGGLPVVQQDPAIVPDVYAGLPLIISGRYARPATGVIVLRGKRNGEDVALPVEVSLPAQADLPPVASLWARRRIEQLGRPSELSSDLVEKSITDLGLSFHLMTAYTSFVAVDRSRVVSDGQPAVVEQPSLVPEGVNARTTVGEAYSPRGSWRDNAAQQRSYSGRSGGGGGGGGWFGSGESPRSPIAPIMFAVSLILLGVMWRSLRRRAG